MDSGHLHIYCHFLISRDLCCRAFGTEHACELPRHGSQQACLPCTLCFLSFVYLKELGNKSRGMKKALKRCMHGSA